MRTRLNKTILIMLCLWSGIIFATQDWLSKPEVAAFIRARVSQDHFSEREVKAAISAAVYQPAIINSMERPYEKKNWDVYQSLFLTEERIQGGLAFWKNNQAALREAEARYGVPADMIVAIIGIETSYGKNQGSYRVLDALSTLAFFYPKRSAFFAKELREYLLLCREHGVSPTAYYGSYAGAMGKPQFMPSSYRYYAVTAQGKNHPDLMQNDRDVIHSVANYFHKNGWRNNEHITQPAIISSSASKHLTTNSRLPNYTYSQLRKTGVKPLGSLQSIPTRAGVIELLTEKGQEYWVAYPNFYVITRYNTSPQYALAAYLLSQRLRQQWALIQSNHHAHG